MNYEFKDKNEKKIMLNIWVIMIIETKYNSYEKVIDISGVCCQKGLDE